MDYMYQKLIGILHDEEIDPLFLHSLPNGFPPSFQLFCRNLNANSFFRNTHYGLLYLKKILYIGFK